MNTTTLRIEPGKWYYMRTGPCDRRPVAAIEPAWKTAAQYGTGRTAPIWKAIDADGWRHEINNFDFERQGIGQLTGIAEDMPELTADDVTALDAKREQKLNHEAQKRADKKAADEKARAELPGKYPFLVPMEQTPKMSSHAAGAKNVKRHLEREFPGVKFSARSKSYSGGCSIDVEWVDGPTDEQARKIYDKYGTKDFDGMTDCESYRDNLLADVFGGAGYVHGRRETSDEVTQFAIDYVWETYSWADGNAKPTPAQWRNGETWGIKMKNGNGYNDDMQAMIHRCLAVVSVSAGVIVMIDSDY